MVASLFLSGCGSNAEASVEETGAPAETIQEIQESEVVETTEEVKEPEIVYQLNLSDTAFADVCVLSDTLYAYKLNEESNWIVAKCEDNTILEIQTGEELIPYLQDNAFAFNAYAEPNNFLYDAEGNLIWEATGKVTDAPNKNLIQFSIGGYCDNVLFLEERGGFVTLYLDGLNDFNYDTYIQMIDYGRVCGMPFANGYLTSDVNYDTAFGIFNLISREQERIELNYEDYCMAIYDSSVSTDGWVYVTFAKKELFGTKDDSSSIAGFYNVETKEARFIEDFFAVEIKHFPENGNTLSSVKNGVAVMYGEPEKWYGKTSEYVQDPPHYMVYDVENGVILKEDLQDVKMAEDEYVLIKGQDEKWQFVDATTFVEISDKYDANVIWFMTKFIKLREISRFPFSNAFFLRF